MRARHLGAGLLAAGLALAGCESATGRAAPRAGLAAPDRPTAAADVVVHEGDPGGEYEVLGPVGAFSDTRYEHRIARAEGLALAELRRVAGEIGADAVIDVRREVVQVATEPLDGGVASSFEDSQRNLLRPGGDVTPSRPVWRVRVTGTAVRTGEAEPL